MSLRRIPIVAVALALLLASFVVRDTAASAVWPFPDWPGHDVYTYSLFKGRGFVQSGEVAMVTNVVTEMVRVTRVTTFTNITGGPQILTVTNVTTGIVSTLTNAGPFTNIHTLTEYLEVPGTNRKTNITTVLIPFLAEEERWFFEASVLGTNLISTRVQTPGRALDLMPVPLDTVQDGSPQYVASHQGLYEEARFTRWTAKSAADFEREIGSGDFRVSIDSMRFGVQTDTLSFAADLFPEVVPTVTGNGVQIYNRATAQWETPVPYYADSDLILETQPIPSSCFFSFYIAEMPQDPTAQAIAKPAVFRVTEYTAQRMAMKVQRGELKAGRRYIGSLRFSRQTKRRYPSGIQAADGSAGYFNETTFYIKVAEPSGPALSIERIGSPQPGSYNVALPVQDGMNPRIQASSDLVVWTDVPGAAVVNGKVSVQFNVANAPATFFRAVRAGEF